MLPDSIPNEQLTTQDVPAANADWDEIQRFALTFNGYDVNGSFEQCAEIANQQRHHASLSDLRTCLFFEQRRWRHFGDEPNKEAMQYIRSVVNSIRERVAAAERGGNADFQNV